MQMEGIAGLRGWQWIFIMEGIITCTIAFLAYIFIVRFPDQEAVKPSFGFLKPEEAQWVVDTLNTDRADVQTEPFNIWKFLSPAKEIEIWGFALIFFMITTVTYSFAFFMPIILSQGLGFSVAASQCLVAPPYVLSGILMYVTSYWGDKYHMRMPILVLNSCISLIGLPMMAFAKSQAVRYLGVFIGAAGINANVPTAMSYQANNIRGQWKRAFCSATLTGFGGIGGIAGSLIFRSQDAPTYVPGFIGVIV
jgi:MFS family permease